MKSVLVTKELQRSLLPYRQIPTYFGRPKTKRLDKWFYKLDLSRFGIHVTNPIDCMNFIIEHMEYYDDQVTHGLEEHWLESPEQVYEWIFDKRKDDCDGAAVSLASILHSVGNTDVRLVVGYYGDPRYANTEKQQINHAYCLIEKDGTHYLIDAVGDRMQKKLTKIDDHPEYITYISAAADGRIWIHGPWIEEFC